MKIRNGHVSNSSSSSFVIGIGIIKPERLEYVKKIFDEEGEDYDVIEFNKSFDEIHNDLKTSWNVNIYKHNDNQLKAVVESFDYTTLSLIANPGDIIFAMDICGGVDDETMIVRDSDGDFEEYNYDIDYSDLDDTAKKLENIFNSENFYSFETAYGAGRDG